MEKCQKCKKKVCLIYCRSCSSYYCLECDRLTHNLPKNKKHKRKNITSSLLNFQKSSNNIKINYNNLNNKSWKNKFKFKGSKTQNNFHKSKINEEEDPNIRLIKKLEYNLNNDIDLIDNNNRNEKLLLDYKNDFNKLYKYIKITNIQNKIDINNLFNIIEEQDIIINDLFKKINFLKQKIKDNIFIDKNIYDPNLDINNIITKKNYFDKKLDIINQIYEKQKQELIKEQENKIFKIKLEYNKIKDKYLSMINYKADNPKNNELNDIIKKLKLDKYNLNINANKLSKINDELNITEFCMNEHIDELIFKLGNNKINGQVKENIYESKKINKYNYKIRYNSYNGKEKKNIKK